MARPLKLERAPAIQITLDRELDQILLERALRNRLTRSRVIRDLLRRGLEAERAVNAHEADKRV